MSYLDPALLQYYKKQIKEMNKVTKQCFVIIFIIIVPTVDTKDKG